MSEEQIKKVIELLSEIIEQGTDLSWQTVEKTEMLLKELKPKEDEIEDRTADIDEDMPGEFVKIKEDELS